MGIAICPKCQASGEVHDPRGYHKVKCPVCLGECLIPSEARHRWMVENGLESFALEVDFDDPDEAVTAEPCPTCTHCEDCGGKRFVDPAVATVIKALKLGR